MAKRKFYVVWEGRKTGVFETWEECAEQIKGFPKAKYKSFPTRELADDAFGKSYYAYAGKNKEVKVITELSPEQLAIIGSPIAESISVDGAWDNTTGLVEYQGVETHSKKVLFHQGPFEDGTINIVEFLAIVHALAYCKKINSTLPIYSDSKIAIKWVRKKEARTKHPPSDKNQKLFELLDRAITWLKTNEYDNKILKWETKAWGENPADFGRK
jgi:ribonuclease HI